MALRAALYVWPCDQRPKDTNGHAGVLHAKCAVADGQLLFLSSANLTEYAMNLNMELGVLIRSAPHAERVAAQFEQLIATCRDLDKQPRADALVGLTIKR